MSGPFRADLDGLATLAERMHGFALRAERLGADIESAVRVLHADWTGAAADRHAAAHRRWVAGDTAMRSAAGRLAHLVETARGNYRSAVTANAAMWS